MPELGGYRLRRCNRGGLLRCLSPCFLTLNTRVQCVIFVMKQALAKPDSVVMKRLIQLLLIALALFFEVTLLAVAALLVSPLGCGCRRSSDCANFSFAADVRAADVAGCGGNDSSGLSFAVAQRWMRTAARTGLGVGIVWLWLPLFYRYSA